MLLSGFDKVFSSRSFPQVSLKKSSVFLSWPLIMCEILHVNVSREVSPNPKPQTTHLWTLKSELRPGTLARYSLMSEN